MKKTKSHDDRFAQCFDSALRTSGSVVRIFFVQSDGLVPDVYPARNAPSSYHRCST
jgi:hypothetical protein